MASFPKRFFVRPAERVLVEARIARPWALERIVVSLLVAAILWGGLAATFLLGPLEGKAAAVRLASILFTLHVAITLVYVWRRVATAEYIVTDESVYARRGQLVLHVEATNLDRVTDLYVHTSLIGRLFGYSGLSVRTAGGGIHLAGLRDAYRIRAVIQEARHGFVAKLLAESGRSREAAPATTYCACPRCAFVFSVAPTRPIDVTCPTCGETGTLFEEAGA